jgi:hypothetical protein
MLVFFGITSMQSILAQDVFTSNGSGTDYNTAANWTITRDGDNAGTSNYPGETSGSSDGPDIIVIQTGHTLILDAGVSNNVGSITINGTGQLQIATFTITADGDITGNSVTIGTGTLNANADLGNSVNSLSVITCSGASSINVSGDWYVDSFTASSSTVSFSGTGSQSLGSSNTFYIINVIKTGGTLALSAESIQTNRDFLLSGSGGTVDAGSCQITIRRDFIRSNGTFTASSSTLIFDSQAFNSQIQSDTDLAFNNITYSQSTSDDVGLTFYNSGSGNRIFNINGIFRKLGTSNLTLSNGSGTGMAIAYGSSGILQYGITGTVGAVWPLTSGPIEVKITSGTTTFNINTSLTNLTLDGGSFTIGGSGVLTVSGVATLRNNTLTNSGSLTINGTLDMNGGTFSTSGTFSYGGAATLKYSASSPQTTAAEWPAVGTNVPNVVISNTNDITIASSADKTATNLTLSSGELKTAGTLNITGNVTASTGKLGVTDGGTLNVSGTSNKIVASGNLELDNLTISSTAGELNGITVNNALVVSNTSGNVSLTGSVTIADGCTLTVSGSGGLLNLNGKLLSVGSTGTRLEVAGTLKTGGSSFNGFAQYSLSGTVEFSGAISETMYGFSFTNLTLNNTSADGVSVSTGTSPSVSGIFSLTDGVLKTANGTFTITSAPTDISSGSEESYIEGPVNVQTNSTTERVLPVGKNGLWRRIGITPSASTTTTYTAQFFDADPQQVYGSSLGTNVAVVSSLHYWTISGSVAANVRLYWESGADGVGNVSTLLAVRWNGSSWVRSDINNADTGSGSTTSGNVVSYTTFSSFGPFALGSSAGDNSLPVTLSLFKAEPSSGGVSLSWSTQSELENEGFYLYRRAAKQASDWQLLTAALIPGQGNTSEKTDYSYFDRLVKAGQTYEYLLESVSLAGVRVTEKIVEVAVPVPTEYAMLGNYPNPFNPSTRIGFRLPETSDVTLKIYGVQGNLVRELALNQSYEAGDHYLTWDGTDSDGQSVASGMYVYLVSAGSFKQTAKMLLIK